MNNITITGRLTAEPETRTSNNGTTVCNIRVAVNRAYSKEADFFSATAFGKTAEFITKYFHKGDGIAINGTMQNNRYEDKEGNKKDKWQIVVGNAEFNGRKPSQNTDEEPDDTELPF